MFKRVGQGVATSTKSRRASSAAGSLASSTINTSAGTTSNIDTNTAMTPIEPPTGDPFDLTTSPTDAPAFSGPGDTLLPGESYTHLLTPSLPFEPDFFETWATLCDVLIDTYAKIMTLLEQPEYTISSSMRTDGGSSGLGSSSSGGAGGGGGGGVSGAGGPAGGSGAISASSAGIPGIGELFAKADARVRKVLIAGVVREFEEASRAGSRAEVGGVGRVVLAGLM
jgi:uncharacterized membrane protein YgcG